MRATVSRIAAVKVTLPSCRLSTSATPQTPSTSMVRPSNTDSRRNAATTATEATPNAPQISKPLVPTIGRGRTPPSG